jgi:hypothetical protein
LDGTQPLRRSGPRRATVAASRGHAGASARAVAERAAAQP